MSLINDSHRQEVRGVGGNVWYLLPSPLLAGMQCVSIPVPKATAPVRLLSPTAAATVTVNSLLWVPGTASSCRPFRFKGGNGSPVLLVPWCFTIPQGFPHPSSNSPQSPRPSALFLARALNDGASHCCFCFSVYSRGLHLHLAPITSHSLWVLNRHLLKEGIKPCMNSHT